MILYSSEQSGTTKYEYTHAYVHTIGRDHQLLFNSCLLVLLPKKECAMHHGHLPHYDVICCSSLISKNKVADSKILISMSRYIQPEARCDSWEQINWDDFGSFLCPVVFILSWFNSLVTPVLSFGIRAGARLISPINVTAWNITLVQPFKVNLFFFLLLLFRHFICFVCLGVKLFITTRSDF